MSGDKNEAARVKWINKRRVERKILTSGEIKTRRPKRRRGGASALKQRACVNSMAAAAFLAEQISWPEEKDKHRRGNHV